MIYVGDNRPILHGLPTESVDLVYIDREQGSPMGVPCSQRCSNRRAEHSASRFVHCRHDPSSAEIVLDGAWSESKRVSSDLRDQVAKHGVLDFSQWQDEAEFSGEFQELVHGLGIRGRTGTLSLDSWQAVRRASAPTRLER